jgi:hypothetical protein
MPPAKIDSLADDVKPLGLLEQISGLTARVDEGQIRLGASRQSQTFCSP